MKAFLKLTVFYYNILRWRLWVLIGLIVMAVSLEGIGISFLMPLLGGLDSENKINQILKPFMEAFGVKYCLLSLLVLMVLVITVRSLLMMVQAAMTFKMASDILVTVRETLSKKIFQINYQAFLKYSSGYLNNALVIEAQFAVYSFKMLTNTLVSFFFVCVYVGIPFCMNPWLVATVGLFGVPLIPLLLYINRRTCEISIENSSRSGTLQKILIQSLSYFKYLKATAKYPNVLKQISQQSRHLGDVQVKQNLLSVFSETGFEPYMMLILASIVYYYVEINGVKITDCAVLLFLLMRAMKATLNLQQNIRNMFSHWGSINIIENLTNDLDHHHETSPPHEGMELRFDREIRFEKVSFSYQDGEELLHSISLSVPANTTVAFVGESGSGKSTLVNLLIGLLTPSSGRISIGDVPYDKLAFEELRHNVGYITQENIVFNDSIYNNITLWSSDDSPADRERVRQMVRKAHLGDFIESLDLKYDSMLGEGGINISGGQRQRLCIARELYKDPQILVFDEATSALDTRTEKEIQRNIDEFKGQKTIVLIAHRLSTIRNADRIFVLKDGCIAEQGSYDELYSANGEFRQMVDHQNLDVTSDKADLEQERESCSGK